MNRIKKKTKFGNTQIIIKSTKGQQLNENEVYDINTNKVEGLLHLEVVKQEKYFRLFYNVTGFITLRDYLSIPLDRDRFAKILENILQNLQSMERKYLNSQYLLLDFDHIMVNPATQKLYFIYVPIQFFESGASLREFLLGIIQHATFIEDRVEANYIQEYISILNNGLHFSIFDLEQYVQRLISQKNADTRYVECPKCHAVFQEEVTYCSHCGTRIESQAKRKADHVYDPLQAKNDKKETMSNETAGSERKTCTQGLSDGTVVLGEEHDLTTVLGSQELELPRGYLIREKTGQKILLDKDSFRIGKDPHLCDYAIDDNRAISRQHARICRKERRFYICDLGSTNHTYVDGKRIPDGKEIEISSGAALCFADEDFTFGVE